MFGINLYEDKDTPQNITEQHSSGENPHNIDKYMFQHLFI